MSKAFTKEQDETPVDEQLLEATPVAGVSGGTPKKNYITPVGERRLRDELHELLVEKRPEVVRTVAWAASNGDRSENGDYIYGKRRLREIDRRIRFLQKRLEIAEVIDPLKQASVGRVVFGATVTVCDEEGEERTYSIVGVDETDPQRGRVSWISPIAKALLNAKVGEYRTLRTPKGEQELEVIALRFEAIL
jgi:transcription elongation factor GreB